MMMPVRPRDVFIRLAVTLPLGMPLAGCATTDEPVFAVTHTLSHADKVRFWLVPANPAYLACLRDGYISPEACKIRHP